MKILIVQQRFGIGDMIIFTPYLHAISQYHGVPVTILAKKSSKADELFEDDNHIDEIIFLDKKQDGIKGMHSLCNKIKKYNFNKCYIFNSSLRYKIIMKLAGIEEINQYPIFKSKDIIFQTARDFTEKVLKRKISTQSKLVINKNLISKVKIDYKMNNDIKHIILGVSASGETKKWHKESYIKLIRKISEKNACKFYIAAGQDDSFNVNSILNSVSGDKCISLVHLSIKEIMPIIKNADLYVGNDTSFMHISSALGVKSLGIFMDTPAYSYSGYSKNIIPIVPEGETLESTTHDTLGKDKISFDKVLKSSLLNL